MMGERVQAQFIKKEENGGVRRESGPKKGKQATGYNNNNGVIIQPPLNELDLIDGLISKAKHDHM